MPAFLDLSGVSKRFGGVQALRDVSLRVRAGEVHCLVGENGSGKSTLIKIISGVLAPEPGGRIAIDGVEQPRLTPTRSTAAGVQVIYQDLSLFPNLSVAENIAIGRHLGGLRLVDRAAIRRTALAAMARLGVTLDPDAPVGELGVSQRQLVAICRALAADAKLLIMDEPTASLTRAEVDHLLALVRELKARGLCVMFVSHRLDEVLEVADRVTVLRDGALVGAYPAEGMSDARLSRLMTGKDFSYALKTDDLSARPVALSARGLSRAGEYADVSFDLREGEILGITGLLGAGRTELALTLFGMTRPDAGEIAIAGRTVTLDSNRRAIEAGVAYVSEDRLTLGLVMAQPVAANLLITVLHALAGRLGLIAPARRRKAAQDWIDDLAIKVSDPQNPVGTLSGGNQQRVALAKWMARRPKVLILDSPTVGVDISAKDGIYEIVGRLAAEGVAVLMISDEIPEVFHHCHRVMVMRAGRLSPPVRPVETSEAALREAVNA